MELGYWIGGTGPAIVLLNGWPQSAYEWRSVAPILAEQHTVIAVDLPGTGESSLAPSGYAKRSIAQRVHALVRYLGVGPVALVGHDIGGMVAFQYAAQFPDDVTQLVLVEAPVPSEAFFGIPSYGPDGTGVWWFGFHNVASLPEELIVDRERPYYSWFFRALAANPDAIDDTAIDEYVRTSSGRDRVAAGLEYYRAFTQDIADNAAYAETQIATPVLAIGAERGIGDGVAQLVQPFARDVVPAVIADSGHWIPEEQPASLVSTISPYLK